MKLAFVILRMFHHGGLQKTFLSILMEAIRRQHEIAVFTTQWEGDIPAGCDVKTLKAAASTNHGVIKAFLKELEPNLKAFGADVVVGFNKMPMLDIYYCGDVCYADYIKRQKSRWIAPLVKRTTRYKTHTFLEKAVFGEGSPTQILSISETHDKNYRAYYNTEVNRFHPLPPGIKREAFMQARTADESLRASQQKLRETFNIPKDAKVFLMVGTDFKRKGVRRVIEAFKRLAPTVRQNAYLVVVGEGKPARYRLKAYLDGLGSHIRFTGASHEVPTWISMTHVLIHAAHFETAGSAILEAIVAGKPVFVSENCGFAFHVDTCNAGQVIPENSGFPHALGMAIETSLSDTRLYEEWCQNAKNYADSENLYSRPPHALNCIEEISAQLRTNTIPKEQENSHLVQQ